MNYILYLFNEFLKSAMFSLLWKAVTDFFFHISSEADYILLQGMILLDYVKAAIVQQTLLQ